MKKTATTFTHPTSLARFLRVYKGLGQQKVAEACKLHITEVSRFERGHRGMAIGKILSIADYFGVAVHDLIYDRYDHVLSTLAPNPRRNPNVQKRLKHRQKRRDELGRDGENYVAQLEREKLKDTPYANGVNEGYADDLSAGFDIMSFSRDGNPICIEVKTTSGSVDDPFYLTTREKEFLEYCVESGIRYELHRVYHLVKGGRPGRRIYTAEELMGFTYEPTTYLVKRGA